MRNDDIAIVGLSCRFPGARNKEEYWHNLLEGVESIARLSEEQMRCAGELEHAIYSSGYVPSSPILQDVDRFDARFFGISDKEAILMDPQQRLLLEVTYEALEDAACLDAKSRERTGVYATGGGVTTSYLFNKAPMLDDVYRGTASVLHIGNDKDFLATRLSYMFDLNGPSMTVQTACSSSLVALHLARTALLAREVDVAIVGASNVRVPHCIGYDTVKDPLLSRDGHCKAFSSEASGTVFGSGVGVVILKRCKQALQDSDHIYAVIRAIALNNDGKQKIGYTASSVPAQSRAMVTAMAHANVMARDISYVECHGTATKLGDPLEIKALTSAFRAYTDENEFCRIGSVKTNIGHLEQAAGMAGLIKLALMIEHGRLVPSLHFKEPNKKIHFDSTPFNVQQISEPWSVKDPTGRTRPRIAGLNSLGIGGTNAFAILSNIDEGLLPSVETDADSTEKWWEEVFCLSAKSRESLLDYLQKFIDELEENKKFDIRSVCKTVNRSRSYHRFRFAGVIRQGDSVLEFLQRATASVSKMKEKLVPIKKTLYLCNPINTVGRPVIDKFLDNEYCYVLKEEYWRVRAMLKHEIDSASSSIEREVYETIAFEAALVKQCNAWGLVFDTICSIGFGYYVKTIALEGRLTDEDLRSLHKAVREQKECTDITTLYLADSVVDEAALNSLNDMVEYYDTAAGIVRLAKNRLADFQHWSFEWCVKYYRVSLPYTINESEQGLLGEVMDGIDAENAYLVFRNQYNLPVQLKNKVSKLAEIAVGKDLAISVSALLELLANATQSGINIDWEAFYRNSVVKTCSLPTYPFKRQRYWIGGPEGNTTVGTLYV